MSRRFHLQKAVLLGLALSLAGVLLAKHEPDQKLVVNGKTTNASVVQIDGHSYVDLEALAQITHGSVTFEPNQIVLTIPNTNSEAATRQVVQGFSKGFTSAAIVALAKLQEWKGVLGTMVTFGLAVDGTWAQTYRQGVEAGLAQASISASTDSDHNALQLLTTQFGNLAKWESDLVAERQDLNGARTVDPNALQNDPVLAKFSSCGEFLSTMLASGDFADYSNCD